MNQAWRVSWAFNIWSYLYNWNMLHRHVRWDLWCPQLDMFDVPIFISNCLPPEVTAASSATVSTELLWKQLLHPCWCPERNWFCLHRPQVCFVNLIVMMKCSERVSVRSDKNWFPDLRSILGTNQSDSRWRVSLMENVTMLNFLNVP